MCLYNVSKEDVTIPDALLLRFCVKVHQIYGVESLTPNIHLHCHLATCVREFGPLHSYWLFPFKRYNGIFGSEATNNRSVEM